MHRILIELESDSIVLDAEGEFDAYTAPALRTSLEEAEEAGLGRLVADLSRVSFLDSTALGVLVRAVKDIVERGGQARVVLPTTTARRIFEITTLDRVLPVSGSRAEALDELAAADDVAATGGS